MIPNQSNKGNNEMTKFNTIVVATVIQAALFNEILKGEIINEGGRWNGVRTKNHAAPFVDSKARVAKEGEALGLTFAAPKRNYNFNDSTWVNPAENFDRLMAVAVKANKGAEVTKKQLTGSLEDLKNIFKDSAQPEPVVAPAVAETAQTPAVEGEQLAA